MLDQIIIWCNTNSGFISVVLFFTTLFLGWATGIFRSLLKKPRFRINVIEGPTCCCTFETGEKFNNYTVHKTAISLYLKISNIGTSPSSICDVNVAYHWNLKPFNLLWLRYSVFWYWLKHVTITVESFQVKIGEFIKVYPSLFQGNDITGKQTDTYLEVGKMTTGVVYFEQDKSYGGMYPIQKNNQVKIKISIQDSFGNKHIKKAKIPVVSLDEAKQYNPSFGETFNVLNSKKTT